MSLERINGMGGVCGMENGSGNQITLNELCLKVCLSVVVEWPPPPIVSVCMGPKLCSEPTKQR